MQVSKLASPSAGAVHRYQTEAWAGWPACLGSFGSAVASTVVPASVPESPLIVWAFAKLSFAGGAAAAEDTNTNMHATAPAAMSTTVRHQCILACASWANGSCL